MSESTKMFEITKLEMEYEKTSCEHTKENILKQIKEIEKTIPQS